MKHTLRSLTQDALVLLPVSLLSMLLVAGLFWAVGISPFPVEKTWAAILPDGTERSFPSDQELQRHRLAAAALADDADGLVGFDGEVEVAQDLLPAEPDGHAAELNDGVGHVTSPSTWRPARRRRGRCWPTWTGRSRGR